MKAIYQKLLKHLKSEFTYGDAATIGTAVILELLRRYL